MPEREKTDDLTLRRSNADIQKLDDVFCSRICESAKEAVVVLDEKGDIVYLNKAAELLFGYKRDKVKGANLFRLIDQESSEQLKQSEQNLRTILDHLQTGIFIVDYETKEILEVNPVAALLIGLPKEEIIGRRCHHFVCMKSEEECPITNFQKGMENREGILLTASGDEISVIKNVVPIVLGGKRCLLESFVDISVQKERERQLLMMQQEAEKIARAKAEFLANMSHEIRTPLNAIIGMTGLLLDTPLDDEQQDYVETIRNAGDALLSLINDVLDFSKIESGRLELEEIPFDLRSLVESVSDLMAPKASEKGLELTCFVDPSSLVHLRGDPDRIRQILVNLVANAVKFTEEGNVDIRVQAFARDSQSATVRFTVKDTGIGIPEEQQGIIFDSFRQADGSTRRLYEGTGLGLSICKLLTEQMGGEIGVESKVGEGSSFWFTVPLKIDSWFEQESRENQLEHAISGARLLIVDDNPVNRAVLAKNLDSFDCTYEEAESGRAALDALAAAHASGRPFDVVLLDYQMPGMDGEEVLRAMRSDARFADTRVIVLTSLGRTGEVHRFQKLGCSAYLIKPVKQSQFLETLAKVLTDVEHGRRESVFMAERKAGKDQSPAEFIDRNVRVLLAEDNIVNQKVVRRILEKAGYTVDCVADGLEAVETLRSVPYDIVLMDIQMPVMDGCQATEEIRRLPPPASQTPIIALTARALSGDREKFLAAGMDDYVSKPLKHEDLLKVVERWAGKHKETLPGKDSANRFRKQDVDLVDIKHLRALVGDDLQFFEELLEALEKSIAENLEAIETALTSSDSEMMAIQAHAIKGAAGNFGALRLYQLALQVEKRARSGSISGSEELLADLKQIFDQTITFLKERAAPLLFKQTTTVRP